MNSWIPKNKFLKFVGLIALLSILLYVAELFVVLDKKKAIEDSYRNTESESSKEEKALVFKSISEANKEYIKFLRQFFVQKGDEVAFIEQIENAARASSVKFEISSIDAKTNQADSFKEDIEIKMKIEGSWANAMRFVDKLEKMPFGILIRNVNLDANSRKLWSGSVEFIIFREK